MQSDKVFFQPPTGDVSTGRLDYQDKSGTWHSVYEVSMLSAQKILVHLNQLALDRSSLTKDTSILEFFATDSRRCHCVSEITRLLGIEEELDLEVINALIFAYGGKDQGAIMQWLFPVRSQREESESKENQETIENVLAYYVANVSRIESSIVNAFQLIATLSQYEIDSILKHCIELNKTQEDKQEEKFKALQKGIAQNIDELLENINF